jgi:hypothetical protein
MKSLIKIVVALCVVFQNLPASAQQVEKPDTPKEFRQSIEPLKRNYVQNLEPMLGNTNPDIIYTMPQASERVWNPMMIKMAATTTWFYLKAENVVDMNHTAIGVPLWQLFKYVELKPENYELIRVERKIVNPESSSDATKATLWFTYIEKQYVLSIK